MSFEIKPATRTGLKALCGFFGRSGSGKSMSALLFARGLVGPNGRIGLIDTENRRGSIFADLIPGGYSVLDFDAPFTPERYMEATDAMEAQCDCLIYDSLSHLWSGEGGVLDLHEQALDRMTKGSTDWKERERLNWPAWREPKMAYKVFVNRLLRSKCHVICCLRGEEKSHIVKDDRGKNIVVTDDFSSPIFDSRFIFEMLVNFETLNIGGKGGFVRVIKTTHPAIAPLLPANNEQIGIKHGEALAKWCAAPTASATAPATAPMKPKTDPTLSKLKKHLWDMTIHVHNGTPDKLVQWLVDEMVLTPEQTLSDLNAVQLAEVIGKVEDKLGADVIP